MAIAISALGVLQIFSATHDTQWKDAWWKQIVFIVVGLFLMWLMAAIDYHSLLGKVPVLYLLSIVTLLAVLLIGTKVFGSTRWIRIGGFTFQTSEFVKLVLILLVARYLTELRSDTMDGWELLKLSGLVGIPMILVVKQPDLGTALTYLPILGIGVYLAGLREQYLFVIGLLMVAVLAVGSNFLQDYQKARLYSFLNPD